MYQKLTVAERLGEIQKEEKYCDHEFLLKNGETFKGHKLIFAISSPVFDDLLYRRTAIRSDECETAAQNDVIKIDDIDPETFKSMAEFFYTDKLNLVSINEAVSVYEAAHKYNATDLLCLSEDYIVLNMKFDDTLKLYQFATSYNILSIKKSSIQLIRDRTEIILNSNYLFNCDLNLLQEVVKSERLSIREYHLFNCIERWAYEKAKTMTGDTPFELVKQLLRDFEIVPNIRFLAMKASDFISTAYQSELLTDEEKHSILMNLSSPNGGFLMPNGFTNCAFPRITVCCSYHNIMVNPTLGSLWVSCTLTSKWVLGENEENLHSSSDPIYMQVDADDVIDSISNSSEAVLSRTRGAIIFESLLTDHFMPSSRIKIAGVVLNADVGVAERFRIDFLCKNSSSVNNTRTMNNRRASVHDNGVDIALHFNIRFDHNLVVCNTKINCHWRSDWEQDGPMVFNRGEACVIDIYCWEEAFQIFVNGSSYCYYAHRIEPHLITHVAVGGCLDIHSFQYYPNKVADMISLIDYTYNPSSSDEVPIIYRHQSFSNLSRSTIILESLLIDSFLPTSSLNITGFVLNVDALPDWFNIELVCKMNDYERRIGLPSVTTSSNHSNDKDIAFNLSVIFRNGQATVACNSKIDGHWNTHQPIDDHRLLVNIIRGSTFIVKIYCQKDAYKVVINGSVCLYYVHRCKPNLVTHVAVGGCLDVQSLQYMSDKGVRQQIETLHHVEPCYNSKRNKRETYDQSNDSPVKRSRSF